MSDDSPGVAFLLSLFELVVSAFLSGGMYRIALKQLRGEPTSVNDLFSAGDVVPALLGATVLALIAIFLGLILCIIPGLILGLLLMFYTPLIVDKRAGVVDSLTMSFNALKPHLGGLMVYALAIIGINLIGLLACGLGLLVTVPVTVVSIAIIYQDFFQGGQAFNANTNLYPPIPTIPQ